VAEVSAPPGPAALRGPAAAAARRVGPSQAHVRLVQQPVATLDGVSATAAEALGQAGIATVFDLGASPLFKGTTPLNGANGAAHGSGSASAAPSNHTELSTALGLRSPQELASWPPYVHAQALVGKLLGGVGAQPGEGDHFRPHFGEYPTERVYYNALSLMHLEQPHAAVKPLTGPLPLHDALTAATAPRAIGVGATLTYSQSWYAQGITLGQLLHSLALAPGEATRVAVVDWSRRSSASDTEATSQEEKLTNKLGDNRAIGEMSKATGESLEQGGSTAHSTATTASSSKSLAGGSGLLESLWGNVDASATEQQGTTTTNANSQAWSAGKKQQNAEMNQNINDTTEQHAHSTRNRMASAVSEISQSEHSTASTRVVANYNHMYALTVQYYEIVEAYRVATELRRADRCIWVPLETIDFTKPDAQAIVQRFRGPLVRGALDLQTAQLLADHDTAVAVTASAPLRVPTAREHAAAAIRRRTESTRSVAELAAGAGLSVAAGTHRSAPRAQAHDATAAGLLASLFGGPAESPAHERARAELASGLLGQLTAGQSQSHAAGPAAAHRLDALLGGSARSHPTIQHGWWDLEEAGAIARLVGRALFRPGSGALHLPADTELVGLSFDGIAAGSVTLGGSGHPTENLHAVPEHATEVELPIPRPLADIDVISVAKRGDTPATGLMRLICLRLGRQFLSPAIPVTLPAGKAAHSVARLHSDATDRRRELVARLQGNRGHYSQVVHRALDSAALLAMLSAYTWNGRPLAEQVEPTPVAVSGGYVILRAPVEPGESSGIVQDGRNLTWADALQASGFGFGEKDERMISTPTSGVYAEAVLGVCNAAEKLDVTRFWNWQDSPIPLTPTELQPPSTESRATMEDARPAGLQAPVVGMMSPPALPNPGAVGAALTSLDNPNMFRDMSGLAGTQALAASTAAQATTAADTAGQLASTNMKTEAQKEVAMAQTAGEIAKAAIAAGSGTGAGAGAGAGKSSTAKTPGGAGISGTGAMINQGAKLDGAGVPFPGSTGSTAATGTVGAAGAPGGSGVLGATGSPTTLAGTAPSGGSEGAEGETPVPASPSWEGEATAHAMFGVAPSLVSALTSPTAAEAGAGAANQYTPVSAAVNLSDCGATDFTPWQHLIDFEIPSSVVAAMAQRTAKPQTIGAAGSGSPVTLDYYAIQITSLPPSLVSSNTDAAHALVSLLEEVRRNFVRRPMCNPALAAFQYYSVAAPACSPSPSQDEQLWLSSDPLSTLFGIRMPIASSGVSPYDDGTVVCSDYLLDPANAAGHWTFSTCEDSCNNNHPVSGNREFGCQLDSTGLTIYTRGVDRVYMGGWRGSLQATGLFPFQTYCEMAWAGADSVWRSFQGAVEGFVAELGGAAKAVAPAVYHCEWSSISSQYGVISV
jgi:hypothetical protein